MRDSGTRGSTEVQEFGARSNVDIFNTTHNGSGQLGINSTTTSLIPTVVDAGVAYSAVTGGANHTCGITTANILKCWGLSTNGQLGNSTLTASLVPVVIDGATTYSTLGFMSQANHTCAITAASAVPGNALKCWGNNVNGNLGLGAQRLDVPWTEVFGTSSNAGVAMTAGAPRILNVTATPGTGAYGVGQTIVLHLLFSESVTVNTAGGTPSIQLNVSPTLRTALYNSGSGTSTLDFTYTVGAGDFSMALDASSYAALSLSGGTIAATAGGLTANSYLPIPSLSNSLSGNQLMVINTTAPNPPESLTMVNPAASSSGLMSASSVITTPTIGVAGVYSGHTVRVFTDSACTQLVGTSTSSTNSVNVTTAPLAFGEYTFYANTTDSLGNVSSCSVSSVSYAYYNSTLPPTITNITSPLVDGLYSSGQIAIQIQFNRYIQLSGTANLTLNTSPSRTIASISGSSSGSGTKILNFIYTVNNGDTSPKLDLLSSAALSLSGSASLTDISGNNATLSLPAPGAVGSLGFNKNIVIGLGSTLPIPPNQISLSNPAQTPGTVTTPSFIVSGGSINSGSTVNIYSDPLCSNSLGSQTSTGTSVTVTATLGFQPGVQTAVYANVTNGSTQSTCSQAYAIYTYSPLVLSAPTTLTLFNPTVSPDVVVTPTLTVSGLLGSAGAPYLVTIYSDSNCIQPVGSALSTSASTQMTILPALTIGTYTFYANQSNQLGSVSPCSSNSLTYQIQESKLSLTTSFQRVLEGSGTQTFNFVLASPLTYPLTVNFDLNNTTAPSTLYTMSNLNSVTIPAGNTSASISLNALNNSLSQGDKFVQLNILSTQPNSVLIAPESNQSRIYFKDLQTTYDPVVHISQGAQALHECAISATGKLSCWGANAYGQIGNNSTVDVATPVQIDSGTNFSWVSVGTSHTCAITTLTSTPAQALKCWGRNNDGQLGDGSTTNQLLPEIIDTGVTYAKVVAGNSHTCALTTTGSIKCWGQNLNGQLGQGHNNAVTLPSTVDPTTIYVQISAGAHHTCAITSSSATPANALKCWGFNAVGQLGDGTQSNFNVPTIIDPGVTYKEISAGYLHTCGITDSAAAPANTLRCWGDNTYYELGDGTNISKTTPTTISGSESFSKVSAGAYSSCALTGLGALKCWGANNSAQLGDGSLASRKSPTDIALGQTFTQVATAAAQTCAIHALGTLQCWGGNSYGQLGQTPASTLSQLTPSITNGASSVASFALGASHSCAIDSWGILSCVGLNDNSQLGRGTGLNSANFTTVDRGTAYSSLALGSVHSCGLTTTGILNCWGSAAQGELGNNSTTIGSAVPMRMDAPNTYLRIAVGANHTCGILSSGALRCWGLNSNGQIGNNTTVNVLLPITIDSGVNYTQIALGTSHTCGITDSNALKCWGLNTFGQLGTNSLTQSNVPVLVDSGVSYTKIALGGKHSCGITTTGVLKCWGYNTSGQLGINSSTLALVPTVIDSGVSYSEIGLGLNHTCGITNANVLKCWGDNTYGQVGNGFTLNVMLPVIIDSGIAYAKLGSMSQASHSCAITAPSASPANTLKCWGQNTSGQLGITSEPRTDLPWLEVLEF